jgi:hypothetical protein
LPFTKWGLANPQDLVVIEECIKTPLDPNGWDIVNVVKQIHIGALFDHSVGQNFNHRRLVTIAKK